MEMNVNFIQDITLMVPIIRDTIIIDLNQDQNNSEMVNVTITIMV